MGKIKVLMIAPLPKEVGGSYTTGVCKVAYEMMQHMTKDIILYISSTNISNKKAKKLSSFLNQYNGFKWLFFDIIVDIIFHPFKVYKEFKVYINECHVSPLRYEFFKVNIRRHITNIKPDIIHVHTTEVPAVFFANNTHIPIINTMHGIFYRPNSKDEKYGDFLRTSVRQCDYFTGLSQECEYYMKKLLHIPNNRIAIIPNGTNTNLYHYDSKQRAMMRKRLDVKESTVVFITVASLQKRKGQLDFIKILENIDFDYQYWLLGEGPDRVLIETYIKNHGLSSKVKCFGSINSDELFKFYSAADIYAHLSSMEGQALSEMEAYSTGIRTIVNKKIKNTVSTNVNNIYVYYILDIDHLDSEDLIKWIQRGNPDRKSRKDVDWKFVTDKYAAFYNKVLNNK